MITFEEFRNGKRALTLWQYCDEFGDADLWDHLSEQERRNLVLLTYRHGLHIEEWPQAEAGKRFYLIIERSEFYSDDLETLERKLYEFDMEELQGGSV